MKIKELRLKNFGKFTNKEIHFSDGMNVIYGENESGKSTLYTFIRAMLFGLERGRGRAAAQDAFSRYEPWENPMLDTMWHFMEMGSLKANYPALKEACMEMRQMIMQKTAGQRKDRPKDIPWENWERVKVTIICEAMALVLSGEYEPKEEGKSERKTAG